LRNNLKSIISTRKGAIHKEVKLLSVPEGKRTESKLAFHTQAIELANYTTTICNNNKIFPKRDRWMIASKIVNASITILTSVVKANGIFVSNKESYKKRREYQELARDSTLELLALIDLSYNKYHIESRKIEYWTRLVYDERKLILKWMKSDKDRFKNLK